MLWLGIGVGNSALRPLVQPEEQLPKPSDRLALDLDLSGGDLSLGESSLGDPLVGAIAKSAQQLKNYSNRAKRSMNQANLRQQ
ncbi:MAG: hypothetical protein HC792_03040 [Acaryochloridaceae cyanobacterium CSU_5_19]|nr:hypothetical protein [Acaryochloridaceae cyanobacterium CSU_5_19]